MTHWLSSGRRRDVCVLLADTDGVRGQTLKTRLEDHYETRMDPSRFYGTLDSLVDGGYVEQHTDGIHDVYALTDQGRAALDDHLAWVREEVATSVEK